MASKLSTDEYAELAELFIDVDASGIELNDHEYKFFEDQKARFERFGVDTYMSGPQWTWLRSIHDRANK